MGEHHQYGKQPDLRQLLNGSSHFQGGTPHVTDPIFVHGRNLNLEPAAQTHYDPTMAGGFMLPSGLVKHGHHDHPDDRCSTNPANVVASAAPPSSASARTVATTGYSGPGRPALYGVELMDSGWIIGNDHSHGGINSRWPRQETLTLLDIRSRLDSRFKEANQKSPLWDEVSRIMAEEHGYQRSGRKCREKFENLYKYYKKTKDGKAGRQDGKHYRFFRQLEALYGETSNETSVSQSHLVNNPSFYQARPANIISRENLEPFRENKQSDSLSFSNTSEFDQTSSSENNDDDLSAIACMMNRSSEKQKGIAEKRCKSKVKNFVDSEMRKVFETQEAWMERTLKTIEDRENERMCRDEEWMKEEAARFNQEREFWAKQIQWIEARDAALVETLKRCTGKQLGLSLSVNKINIAPETDQTHKQNQEIDAETIRNYQEMTHFRWTEAEILSLIQLRSAVETKFQEGGYPGERLWDEIATNMTSLGYDRSINECIEKWDNMNIYFNMSRECNKKRNEDLTTDNYYWELETYNAQESHEKQVPETMDNIPFGSGSSKAAFRFQ